MTAIAGPLATAQPAPVFGGVDTHADSHTAAVIDAAGRLPAPTDSSPRRQPATLS
jgi:hypothetical protein